MMRRIVGMAVMVALVACGGDGGTTGPKLGPLKLGIVSGNHQTALAAKGTLTDAVVGKVVRVAGTNEIRFVHRGALLDGTVVAGSPVPGAVVCAVGVGDVQLTSFTPCTNTDSSGQATFFFYTSNKAGTSRAEIRGTVNNEPTVFDTAVATVLPDSASSLHLLHSGDRDLGVVAVGDTIRFDVQVSNVQDVYGNVITGWIPNWVFSTDSIVGTTYSQPFPAMPNTGLKAPVPAGARTIFAQIGKVKFFLKLRTS